MLTQPLLQKPMINRFLINTASILLIYLSVIPLLFSQELEPRAYADAPVVLNFVVAGYQYSAGGLIFDPGISINDANLYAEDRDENTNALLTRQTNCLVDPSFYFSMNFYGAPALNLQAFRNYKQDTISGFSLKVTPPLGNHEKDKIINIGTNRWSIKPELGISKAINRRIFEATTNITFYTDNTEFNTNLTRKQEPAYSLQGNLTYTFVNYPMASPISPVAKLRPMASPITTYKITHAPAPITIRLVLSSSTAGEPVYNSVT